MQYYSLKDFGIAGKTKDAADTTPVNVVASAYDTSGNGGRKIVRLSNGWIVAVAYDGGVACLRLYVSKDNGTTWSPLCYTDTYYRSSFAIASVGTTVHLVSCAYDSAGQQFNSILYYKFDATTQANVQITARNYIVSETTPGSVGQVSLAIDGTGVLHVAWSAKNSAYANSWNIRYSKSTDGGVIWATPTQMSSVNTSGYDLSNPCIVALSNNSLIIFVQMAYAAANSNAIICYRYSGTAWGASQNVYPGGALSQLNPCAAVDSNDVIHVVWYGKDATDTAKENVRYSKSTDGGTTWAAATKLTTGNTYPQYQPTITIDPNNNLYVFWWGYDAASPSYSNIFKAEYNNNAWSAPVKLTSNTTNTAQRPSSLWSKFNMNSTDAIRWIYQDVQAAAVKYASKPFTKVPDTTPSIIESYIPLWMADGTNASTNITSGAGTYVITDGGGIAAYSSTASNEKLFTLSSNWPVSTKYAFEATIWAYTSGYSVYAELWDMTTNTAVAASQVSTTSLSTITLRSGQFTLTPGHVYAVTLWNGASGGIYITDTSLVVFG